MSKVVSYLDAPKKGAIVPNMGTHLFDNTSTALFGKVRRNLLSLFLLNPENSYYFREITKLIDAGSGAVHRELANLVEAGIITRSKVGNQTRYQVNGESNIYSELHGLLVKTSGIQELIEQSLEKLRSRITVAFIYGSFADGSVKANSDVDLMVIGNLSIQEVVTILQNAQQQLGREINPAVYSPESFRARKESGFILGVLNGSKLFLIGGENELEEMVR